MHIMDPPIINETSFSAANPLSYSLAEIWPFPINGSGEGGGLGLRMGSLTGFGENREEESTVTEQSGSRGGGRKKRKDANSEDESSKLVSTCSGTDLVFHSLSLSLIQFSSRSSCFYC